MFVVHPGGPFWSKKDLRAWSIPKGEYVNDEEPLEVARREFEEETGFSSKGNFIGLGDLKQPGGKIVTAWAFKGDCDPKKLRSNTFMMARAVKLKYPKSTEVIGTRSKTPGGECCPASGSSSTGLSETFR